MNPYKIALTDFKKNYMLYIPLSIILQSCIGSVTAMYILMSSTSNAFPFLQLTLCVMVTMLYNAFVLAQIGYKLVFNTLILSLLINVLLSVISKYMTKIEICSY